MGAEKYGPLDVLGGKRWEREALEEVIDCMFYCAAKLLEIEMRENLRTEEIRRETIKNLTEIVETVEKIKKEERVHDCPAQVDGSSHHCLEGLALSIRERIELLDGSVHEQKSVDWDNWVSTRPCSYVYEDREIHERQKFFDKVGRFDPASVLRKKK